MTRQLSQCARPDAQSAPALTCQRNGIESWWLSIKAHASALSGIPAGATVLYAAVELLGLLHAA